MSGYSRATALTKPPLWLPALNLSARSHACPCIEGGRAHKSPLLPEELLTVDAFWRWESQFSLGPWAPVSSHTLQWVASPCDEYMRSRNWTQRVTKGGRAYHA